MTDKKCFQEVIKERRGLSPLSTDSFINPCSKEPLKECTLPPNFQHRSSCGKYFCRFHSATCCRCGVNGHFPDLHNGFPLDDDCFFICQFCNKIMCLKCFDYESNNSNILIIDSFPKCLDCSWNMDKHTCITCLKGINDSVDEGRDCPFKDLHSDPERDN